MVLNSFNIIIIYFDDIVYPQSHDYVDNVVSGHHAINITNIYFIHAGLTKSPKSLCIWTMFHNLQSMRSHSY